MLPGAALDVPRCACTPPSHPSHRDPRIPSSSPPPPPCVLTFLLLAVVSERRQRSGIGRAKFFFSSSATASPRSHRTAHTATTARTNSHAHRYDTAHTSDCIGRFQRATPAHASDRSSAQRSASAQSSQRRHRAARLCVSLLQPCRARRLCSSLVNPARRLPHGPAWTTRSRTARRHRAAAPRRRSRWRSRLPSCPTRRQRVRAQSEHSGKQGAARCKSVDRAQWHARLARKGARSVRAH